MPKEKKKYRFADRLKEPSTYAGLAAAIAPAAAIPVATPYVMGASAILGTIAVVLKETKNN